VPSKADYYRAKAEAARDLHSKEMFKEVARHWREMAAQAERFAW